MRSGPPPCLVHASSPAHHGPLAAASASASLQPQLSQSRVPTPPPVALSWRGPLVSSPSRSQNKVLAHHHHGATAPSPDSRGDHHRRRARPPPALPPPTRAAASKSRPAATGPAPEWRRAQVDPVSSGPILNSPLPHPLLERAEQSNRIEPSFCASIGVSFSSALTSAVSFWTMLLVCWLFLPSTSAYVRVSEMPD